MFTGLIEEVGTVLKKSNNFLEISTSLDDIKIGDSVSVNGVCLTASRINKSGIKFDVMNETFRISNLKFLKIADKVNLERALKLNSRLGGHIVQGHVEGMAKLVSIKTVGNARILSFNFDSILISKIVPKGSIAINGISLTILDKNEKNFSVSIIPETLRNTNLAFLFLGNEVNIETDYLLKREDVKSNIMDLLKEEGFL